jgi:hypothetical protein
MSGTGESPAIRALRESVLRMLGADSDFIAYLEDQVLPY